MTSSFTWSCINCHESKVGSMRYLGPTNNIGPLCKSCYGMERYGGFKGAWHEFFSTKDLPYPTNWLWFLVMALVWMTTANLIADWIESWFK